MWYRLLWLLFRFASSVYHIRLSARAGDDLHELAIFYIIRVVVHLPAYGVGLCLVSKLGS